MVLGGGLGGGGGRGRDDGGGGGGSDDGGGGVAVVGDYGACISWCRYGVVGIGVYSTSGCSDLR